MIVRVLVIAAIVSGVFSAALTVWEADRSLNSVIASFEEPQATGPAGASETAREEDDALREGVKALRESRMTWIWLAGRERWLYPPLLVLAARVLRRSRETH